MNNATQLRRVFRDSIRLYFAPLTGAFKGISLELKRADRAVQQHRSAEIRAKREQARHA